MAEDGQSNEKDCGILQLLFFPCYLIIVILIIAILPLYVIYLIGKCLVESCMDLWQCRKSSQESGANNAPPPTYDEVRRQDREQALPGYYDLPPRYTPSMQRSSLPAGDEGEFRVEVF